MDDSIAENEDDWFWEDPPSIIKSLINDIKNLEDRLSKQELEKKLFNELDKPLSNLRTIEFCIDNLQYMEIEIVNKVLNHLSCFQKSLSGESVKDKVIKKFTTPYDFLLKDKDKENESTDLAFANLLFANYNFYPAFQIPYYLIFFNLVHILNNKRKSSDVYDILETFKDEIVINDLTNILYVILKKYPSDDSSMIWFKSFYRKHMRNMLLSVVNSMLYYLEKSSFTHIKPFQQLFYNYIPERPYIDNFEKFNFLELDMSILLNIRIKLEDCTSIEIVQKLQNRDFLLSIFNDFNKKRYTKHIMNLFHKEYGKEELFSFIVAIANDMLNHIYYPKKIDELRWKQLEQHFT